MVGIRSVTYQLSGTPVRNQLNQVLMLSHMWDNSFPYIHTQRVCLPPCSERMDSDELKELSKLCNISSVRWFNVPIDPHSGGSPSELFSFAYNVLAEYRLAFVNVLGVANGELRPNILRRCADLIRKTSTLSDNGKDNFRLGISVNIQPDGPFFPFTYSSGELGFSIALELTQEINEIFIQSQSVDLSALRDIVVERITSQVEPINELAEKFSAKTGFVFHGFDFSLAPVIDRNGSIVPILNRLGIYDFGRTGALFATGFLTNTLKILAQRFKSVGFSGVMYSLLEDLELCAINNERGISLEQLIMLSTMCGCGVDMVPVYGKIKNEELMSIFLDVAGISSRLKKPLGVRVLPIPRCGRGKNCFTGFHNDSDFIANTKVVGPNLNLIAELGDLLKY